EPAALEQDTSGDGRVGEVDLELPPQDLLAVPIGGEAIDQVSGFEKVDEPADRGLLEPELGTEGLDVQQAAVVQAEIEERPFQLEHPPDSEQGGHVPLEDLVDDVLPQQLLSQGDALDESRLRETSPQQVLVKVGDQGARGLAGADEIGRAPREKLGEGVQFGKVGQPDVLDLEILRKRQRGQPDGVPPADSGLQALGLQWDGGAGHRDAGPLVEIHLMLEPGLPALGVLDLVEENVLGLLGAGLDLPPDVEDSLQADQLEQGVVEGRIQDAFGPDSAGQELLDRLEEQSGLADLTGAAEQDGPRRGRRTQPEDQLRESRPAPAGKVANGSGLPPGVVLPKYRKDLLQRGYHAYCLPIR